MRVEGIRTRERQAKVERGSEKKRLEGDEFVNKGEWMYVVRNADLALLAS